MRLVFQIKNIVSTAYAPASPKIDRRAISHLEVAVAASNDFECNFKEEVTLVKFPSKVI